MKTWVDALREWWVVFLVLAFAFGTVFAWSRLDKSWARAEPAARLLAPIPAPAPRPQVVPQSIPPARAPYPAPDNPILGSITPVVLPTPELNVPPEPSPRPR